MRKLLLLVLLSMFSYAQPNTCKNFFYEGYLENGLDVFFINNDDRNLRVKILIGDNICYADASVKGQFLTDRIEANITNVECMAGKPFKVKSYLYDTDCILGIKANRNFNNEALEYIVNQIQQGLIDEERIDTFIKIVFGTLDVPQYKKVFVAIEEPSIFLHKNYIEQVLKK